MCVCVYVGEGVGIYFFSFCIFAFWHFGILERGEIYVFFVVVLMVRSIQVLVLMIRKK